MNKLEQAARQVDKTAMRVEQDCEEALGEDGMVMVVPLDAYNDMMEAITALREALAEQAEQEPVLMPVRRGTRITCMESDESCVVWTTSDTHAWVQFPDGQIGKYTYEQIGSYFSLDKNYATDEAYERGLKEGIEAGKKIAEQAEQEPVAWVDAKEEGYEFHGLRELPAGKHHLYAAPVRTKDLTKPEMLTRAVAAGFMLHTGYGQSVNKMMPVSDSATLVEFARAVIAADREKNRG